MARPTRIHQDKEPVRLHFIEEWAAHRQLQPADLCEHVGVDKSTVSRWYSGKLPAEKHLVALADLFQTDVAGLFRDPHDDWMRRMFQDRNAEEQQRIQQMIELALPRRSA